MPYLNKPGIYQTEFMERPLRLYYCDHHSIPLPQGHKFPIEKYRLLREALEEDGRFAMQPSTLAGRNDLLRVHGEAYVDGFLQGSLDRAAIRRIGFPWSPELVTRTLASVGGTLMAARAALETGFGGTLAGGTHHASRDEGSGFCVFNDLAVAIAWARAENGLRRAAIIDLDVHQGDGTAALFQGDPDTFTLSVHAARNFPLCKQASTVDVELGDETGDEEYLTALLPALNRIWDFAPELILFQAGVDGLKADRLGRLALSASGLKQRDELVISSAVSRRIPFLITIGGGYSDPIERTVEAHAGTFRTAADTLLRLKKAGNF